MAHPSVSHLRPQFQETNRSQAKTVDVHAAHCRGCFEKVLQKHKLVREQIRVGVCL